MIKYKKCVLISKEHKRKISPGAKGSASQEDTLVVDEVYNNDTIQQKISSKCKRIEKKYDTRGKTSVVRLFKEASTECKTSTQYALREGDEPILERTKIPSSALKFFEIFLYIGKILP